MAYQGAFEPTNMCADGRVPGSSSTLPSGTYDSAPFAGSATTEPQLPQNARSYTGDDAKRRIASAPFVMRIPAVGVAAYVANAVPCAFRQRPQWQWMIGSSGPSCSQATVPQRQLPCV